MGQLFDKATALTTLVRAFERVEDNAGGPGLDGVGCEEFAADLDTRLQALQEELRRGTYRPEPLLRFMVKKKSGGQRGLSVPTLRDRVAQTAASIILAPILDAEFEDASFGYRAGRSVSGAVERIMWLRDRGYVWVVDADIRNYFDEIPHDRLLDVLGRTIGDPELVALVRRWVEIDVVDGGKRTRLTRGVPQGSPISPLLANLYLDAFDEACEKRGLRLVRYADDFVLLCRNRASAEKALAITEASLAELRLTLNQDKTRVTSFDAGFKYLGVRFVRTLAFRPRFEDTTAIEAQHAKGMHPPALPAGGTAPAASPALELPPGSGGPPTPEPDTAMALALGQALAAAPASATRDTKDEPPPADHDPLLRTLFVMSPGLTLGKEGEHFVARRGEQHVLDIPSLQVDQVAVFGRVGVTTAALHFCARNDVPVYFLASTGGFVAALHAMDGRAVALQAQQFARRGDPAFRLSIAKAIVTAKIANTRTLLLRWQRTGVADADAVAERLLQHGHAVAGAATLDAVRGLEGVSAADYFGLWPHVVPAPFQWTGRKKHPAPDPVNALLSLGYSLLYANALSLARMAGLHPYAGLLHDLKDGHAGIASDLSEEFRAAVVDRAVLRLLRRQEVVPGDFVTPGGNEPVCLLTDAARRRVVRAFEQALNRPVRHPDGGARCDYRRALALQARRLAVAIAGDTPYMPFTLK